MLKTPYPQAIYLFVYSTNILSSGCARHCQVPGDEAMNISDPVRVLLERTVKQKRSLQWLLVFTVRTFTWTLGTQLRHVVRGVGHMPAFILARLGDPGCITPPLRASVSLEIGLTGAATPFMSVVGFSERDGAKLRAVPAGCSSQCCLCWWAVGEPRCPPHGDEGKEDKGLWVQSLVRCWLSPQQHRGQLRPDDPVMGAELCTVGYSAASGASVHRMLTALP